MEIQFIRHIVALVFGITATAAFANILDEKKNIVRLIIVTLGFLLLQLFLFLTWGLELTLSLYPIHTHLVLILVLTILFKCPLLESVICTFLAYMCCQIPAWVSKLAIYTPLRGGGLELLIYIATVSATLSFICRFAAKPVHDLIQSSDRSALAFSIVPITYFLQLFSTKSSKDESRRMKNGLYWKMNFTVWKMK